MSKKKDKRLKVSHTAHTADKGGQQFREGCRPLRGNQLCVFMSQRKRGHAGSFSCS